MNSAIQKIAQEIDLHPQNAVMRGKGYKPIFTAHPLARILIVGQAPGIQTQERNRPWDDKSGEQLRR